MWSYYPVCNQVITSRKALDIHFTWIGELTINRQHYQMYVKDNKGKKKNTIFNCSSDLLAIICSRKKKVLCTQWFIQSNRRISCPFFWANNMSIIQQTGCLPLCFFIFSLNFFFFFGVCVKKKWFANQFSWQDYLKNLVHTGFWTTRKRCKDNWAWSYFKLLHKNNKTNKALVKTTTMQ